MDAEGAEMNSIRSFLLWRDVAWLWVGGGYAGLQLLPLVVQCSTASTRSATVILGLRPHNHLGHREKECAGLMTHRKSDEPHSRPSPAIGQRRAPKSPSHCELELCTKGMWKHSLWSHSRVALLRDTGMLLFSSHLCRGRGGLSEARQRAEGLKLSARSSIPPRLMGSYSWGHEGA